jgi:hypothetical protein
MMLRIILNTQLALKFKESIKFKTNDFCSQSQSIKLSENVTKIY